MVGNSAASITEAHSAAERSLISNTKCTTSENGREQISQFFQRLRGELVVPTQLYSRPLGTRPEFLPSTGSSVLPGQNARSTAARFSFSTLLRPARALSTFVSVYPACSCEHDARPIANAVRTLRIGNCMAHPLGCSTAGAASALPSSRA